MEENIKQEQRKLSRRVKGSSNYRKQKAVVAKAYAKLRHYREDFRHQMSRRLIEDSQFVGVENLAVQNVTRRAKKKVGANGKYARNGQVGQARDEP